MLSGSEIAPTRLPHTKPASKLRPYSKTIPESTNGASEKGQTDDAYDEGPISSDMERANRLFEIMSARSDIDHPICVECTTLLVRGLEQRLEVAGKERDVFAAYLKRLQNEQPTEGELSASRATLQKAMEDEEAATQELLTLEEEKRQVEAEIEELKLELEASAKEVDEFCIADNRFQSSFQQALAKHASLQTALEHDNKLLQLLQRTNVHNDTFSISHDGVFGTINNLRLGRTSAIPVEWSEINAAWGHTLLLLYTVARSAEFNFRGYQLAPMGSTSSIIQLAERGGKRRKLDLWTQGDLPLGLTFMHRRFDAAMVAFLDCLKQLGDYVEAETANNPTVSPPRTMSPRSVGDQASVRESTRVLRGVKRGLELPYQIEGDKIGGFSIRLGVAQDDGWSSACKYVLTCCKYLLAHVSNASLGGGR